MSTTKNSPIVLLLTATIDPGGTPLVARRDPQTRFRDYEQALSFWLRVGAVDKIVFCENSGYGLGALEALAGSSRDCRVEFISFNGNDGGASRGKGFAELVGMEYAVANSELIRDCKWFLKCTGRLTVSNARALVSRIRVMEFDVMCDLRSNLVYSDTRIFAATPEFLTRYLVPQRSMIDDVNGVFLEHALACAAARARADGKIWRPMPVYPHLRGVSGTEDKLLTEGLIKGFAKSIYHRIRTKVYGT
jgi:hypothetical protein